jgi:predicted PurR-regulated permease PerM
MRKDTPLIFVFFVFFILLWYLAFIILRPVLSGILSGLILSYIFFPLYKQIYRVTRLEKISAMIVCGIILLIMIIPLIVIGGSMALESENLVRLAKYTIDQSKNPCANANGFTCGVYNHVLLILSDPNTSAMIQNNIGAILQFFVSEIAAFVRAIPMIVVQIFIALFICYYLVRDGEAILKNLEDLLPLKEDHRRKVSQQISNAVYGVIYGQVIISVMQGVLATIGYFILGLPSPLTLGLLTVVFSFVPVLGTALVWLPAALIVLFQSLAVGDQWGVFRAVALILWGFLVVALSDNLLRPRVIGRRAKIHPVLVLLGVFGGIALFGIIGIIIGPLILSILFELIKIYIQEREYFLG